MGRVTDVERREVARMLREYVDLPDDWWQETCAEFYVEKCVFGNVDRHSEAELFTRLADLIEPDATGDMTKSQSISLSAGLCDRGELLALADEMQGYADGAASGDGYPNVNAGNLWAYADRIREARGEAVDG